MASKNKAFAERERLEEKIRTLSRSKADAERAARSAEHEVDAMKKARLGYVAEIANGDDTARERVRDADAEIDGKRQEIADYRELAEVAERERRKASAELSAHLNANLDAFLAEARGLSEAAEKARAPVIAAAKKAKAADAAARAAWKPLVSAVRQNTEHPGEMKFGERSGRELGQMPPVPSALDQKLLTELADAPAPMPANVRDVSRARRLGDRVVPGAVRRMLGIEHEVTVEPDPVADGVPYVEVIS